MTWTYSEAIHDDTTIMDLASAFIDALTEFVAHAQTAHAPEHFPEADLDQEEYDALLDELELT